MSDPPGIMCVGGNRMFPMGLRLLWVAGDLYEAEGPEGVSLRKLAARLKRSPSTLYKHFQSRGGAPSLRSLRRAGAARDDRPRRWARARALLSRRTIARPART